MNIRPLISITSLVVASQLFASDHHDDQLQTCKKIEDALQQAFDAPVSQLPITIHSVQLDDLERCFPTEFSQIQEDNSDNFKGKVQSLKKAFSQSAWGHENFIYTFWDKAIDVFLED